MRLLLGADLVKQRALIADLENEYEGTSAKADRLLSKDQLEEIEARIAHDCGRITEVSACEEAHVDAFLRDRAEEQEEEQDPQKTEDVLNVVRERRRLRDDLGPARERETAWAALQPEGALALWRYMRSVRDRGRLTAMNDLVAPGQPRQSFPREAVHAYGSPDLGNSIGVPSAEALRLAKLGYFAPLAHMILDVHADIKELESYEVTVRDAMRAVGIVAPDPGDCHPCLGGGAGPCMSEDGARRCETLCAENDSRRGCGIAARSNAECPDGWARCDAKGDAAHSWAARTAVRSGAAAAAQRYDPMTGQERAPRQTSLTADTMPAWMAAAAWADAEQLRGTDPVAKAAVLGNVGLQPAHT